MTSLKSLQAEWCITANADRTGSPYPQVTLRSCASALSPHIHREELYSELVRAARKTKDEVLAGHWHNHGGANGCEVCDAYYELSNALDALETNP